MNNSKNPAPGSPGQFSPWTSGAKTGIGRALNTGSELSFTIGKGLLNEVYFPQEDTACIRECGLVITGKGWLSDERTDTRHRGRMVRPGVPMYVLENKCVKGRYTLYKEILADPERDAVLQRVRFEPGKEAGLSLHVYLTPHLHNSGQENEAWIDEYKGITMLFASGGGLVLAMACDKGWKEWTVGYIGTSDGVTDLRANGRLTSHYDFAGPGQVQLCAAVGTAGTARKAAPGVPSEAKLDYRSGVGAPSGEAGIADRMEFVLAIGFGHTLEGAAHQAKSALLGGFDEARQKYCAQWDGWQKDLWEKGKKRAIRGKYLKESAAALRISESRRYPGGVIASLSIPWG
ncbi:MAG TPA: hypothetical protein VGR89_15990, partial [Puia sp.]|nr:hypothetical protein [Puia sp.]